MDGSLLELSDSFGSIWSSFEAEFGVGLIRTTDPNTWLRRNSPIQIVAAGGAESKAVAVLLESAGRLTRPTVVVGGDPDHRLAMAMIKAGAQEYFVLPDDIEQLRAWLRDRIDGIDQAAQRRTFAAREEAKYRFDGMIGDSPALRHALAIAARIIPRSGVTVLITGETGTGKELLARAIHYNGPRRDSPFVDINCAAIPEQLLESELFGHEKGAFTHATATKPGLFEVANGGTVFLDEIGHLPLALQGKLLRALEQRTIRRVGGTNPIAVDVRIIAATHVDLPDAVRRGDFREDLYYRLNVLPIELPPLRSREGDVVLLAGHFLGRLAEDHDLPTPTVSTAAQARLRDHHWPGNVRELRNVIERSLVLLRHDEIGPDDLAFRATGGAPVSTRTGSTLQALIREAAKETVERCQGNKSEAARRLAISRTRLLRLLDHQNTTDSLDGDDQ